MSTKNVTAYLNACRAIADAIRDLGSVPSGHLYAISVMQHMGLETYQSIIDTLVHAKVVRKEPSHLLVWTGPAPEAPCPTG